MQDVKDSFNKGYNQGKNSVAIEKSQPSEIKKEKVNNRIVTNTRTSGFITFNNRTSTIQIDINER